MATPFRLKRSAVADRRPTTTDLQLGELALNTHDGFLYAETTGVGSTVSLLTPWREQYGSPTSIYYNHRVGIGSTNPTVSLDVVGDTIFQSNLDVAGIATLGSGASGHVDLKYQGAIKLETKSWGARIQGTIQALNGSINSAHTGSQTNSHSFALRNSDGAGATKEVLEIGHTSSNSFITGYVGNISINAPQVSISTNFSVGGISTFTGTVNLNGVIEANSNLNVDGNLDVDGQTNLDDLAVSGISTFTGKIIANSNVGIGTTNPAAPLHISGPDAASARLLIEDNNNNIAASEILVQNGGRDLRISAANDIIFTKVSGGTPLLYLENGQKVGIGTEDPEEVLHIQSGSPVIKFSDGALDSQIRADAGNLKFISHSTSNDFMFQSSIHDTSEVVRITGDGKVGINTSNPRHKLHLDNGTMFIRGDIAPQIRLNGVINDTSSTRFTFGLATGANNFFNGAQALDGCVAAPSDGRLLLGVGVAARMYILNSGDITINRASQLGNTKLSLQCDPAQEGIAVHLNQSSGISTAFAIWNTGGEIFNLAQDADSTPDLIFKIKNTGESAPVEKVRFASDGNVGIGTDNPDSLLHLHSSDPILKLQDSDVEINKWSRLRQVGSDLKIQLRNGSNNGALVIQGYGGGIPTNFVNVDSDGKVGIGTDNPTQKVQINNGADDPNIVLLYGADTSTEYAGIGVFQGNATFTGGGIGSNNTGISLRTSSGGTEIERVRIESSGDVGIGTDDAVSKLHVGGTFSVITQSPLTDDNHTNAAKGGNALFVSNNSTVETARFYCSAAGNTRIHIECSSNNGDSELHFCDQEDRTTGGTDHYEKSSGKIIYEHDNDAFKFDTNRTEKLRLDSSGRLLLGTTTEGHPNADDLTIATSGDTGITIRSGTTHNGRIYFSDATSGTGEVVGSLDYDHNDNKFTIHTNGAERLRIDSSGRLLLGTDTEGHPNADDLTIATSGDTGITIRSGTTNNGRIYFSDATSGTGEVVGSLDYDHNNNKFSIYTNGDARFCINGDGDVGIGDQTPDSRLHVTSSDNVVATFERTGSTYGAKIAFVDALTPPGSPAYVEGYNGELSLGASGSRMMTFSTANGGRVGIGTINNTDQLLTIQGSANVDGDFKVTGVSTFSGEVGFGTHITLKDAAEIRLGEKSGGDLTIEHNPDFFGGNNGAYSAIVNYTGNLIIENRDTSGHNNFAYFKGDNVHLRSYQGNQAILTGSNNSGTKIYFSGSNRFETTTYGALLTGGASGIGTLAGPAIFHIDPTTVGDNTGTVVIKGNLQIDGTTTTVNSTTVTVDDKNLVLASGAANDAAASGGGITIESGDGNKTFTFESTGNGFQSSEHFRVASGKVIGFAAHTGTFLSASASGGFVFTIGNNEKARIRSSGDVNLGANLNVVGVSTFTGKVAISTFATGGELADTHLFVKGGITFSEYTSSGEGHLPAITQFSEGGAQDLAIGTRSSGGDLLFFTGNVNSGTANFGTNANGLRLRISHDGEATFSKTVGISSNLNVAGISTFSDNTHFKDTVRFQDAGGSSKVNFFTFGRLQFNDNVQAAFGNSSQGRIGSDGSDLTISNNAGGSYLGTGNIKIQADAGKESIVGIQSGAVELYFDGVKRFETTNTGVGISSNLTVSGISTLTGQVGFGTHITLPDHAKLKIGTHEDIQIYNKGNLSIIANKASGANSNNNQLHIHSFFDLHQSSTFSQYFKVGNSSGAESHTGGDAALTLRSGGAVEAYYDGEKRFSTSGIGATVHGQLDATQLTVSGVSTFSDTVKIGTGVTALTDGNVSIGGTFEIFESSGIANRNFSQFKLSNFSISQHQNTGSYFIKNSSTGQLLLGGGSGGNGGIGLYNNNLGAKYLRANSERSVEIFHDNVLRFETSGIGATVYGQLDSTQLTVSGISTFNGINNISGEVNIGDSATGSSSNRLRIGASADIQIYHDSSTTNNHFIAQNGLFYLQNDNLRITALNASKPFIQGNVDSSVKLFYAGNEKISTSGVGVTVSNQLDTTNVYATGITTSVGTFHIRPSSGALSPKISFNDSIADAMIWADNVEARFGGSSDFRIYHDTTGDLNILETHLDREVHIRELDGTNIAKFIPGGSVELYENGTKRLETTDTGVGISSNLTVSGVSTFTGTGHFNSGELRINGTNVASLHFNSSTNNPDYRVQNHSGEFQIYDATNDRYKFIAKTNSRVGIHTHNPLRDFHVVGTSRFEQLDVIGFSTFATGTRFFHHTPRIEMQGNNTATISFCNATTGTTNSDGMLMGFSSSSQVGFINVNESGHGFVIKTGSSAVSAERLRISGVGTFSIRNGTEEMVNARPNLGVELYFNGNKRLETTDTGVDITDNLKVAGISTFGGSTQNTVQIYHNSGYGLRVQRGSKFLDFNGDWANSGNAALNAGASGIRFYYGDSSDGIQFNTGTGDDKVRITGSGNVGINSTAPTSKLDVDGDVKVSGITTSTGVINSQTDIRINNVSVIETALNDAVAMAIALG